MADWDFGGLGDVFGAGGIQDPFAPFPGGAGAPQAPQPVTPDTQDWEGQQFDPRDPQGSLLNHLGAHSTNPVIANMLATNPVSAIPFFTSQGIGPPPADIHPDAVSPTLAPKVGAPNALDAIDNAVPPPQPPATVGYATGAPTRPLVPGQDIDPNLPPSPVAGGGVTSVKPIIVRPPPPALGAEETEAGDTGPPPAQPAKTPDVPALPQEPVEAVKPQPVNEPPTDQAKVEKTADKVKQASDSFTKALQAIHAMKPPEVQKISSPPLVRPSQKIAAPDLQQLLAMFHAGAPSQMQRQGLGQALGVRV